MYVVNIIGASDSRDTYENVKTHRIFFDEETKCRVLIMNFDDGGSMVIYLGINDRVEIIK